MDAFLQTDSKWAGMNLGSSPYKVGEPAPGFGCAAMSEINMVAAAGWPIDPAQALEWLNGNGGFTDEHYHETEPGKGDGDAGLIYWRTLSRLFPALHFGVKSEGTLHGEIWIGIVGKYSHFNLHLDDGRILDSIGGSQPWAKASHWQKAYDISCDVYVAPVPETVPLKPADDTVVEEVIAGKYGNGDERVTALTAAGYDAVSVQDAVNVKLAAVPEVPATPAVVSESGTDHYAQLNEFTDTVTVKGTNGEGLNVRSSADPVADNSNVVTTVAEGVALGVTGAIRGTDGNVWYRSVKGNYFCSDWTSKPLK